MAGTIVLVLLTRSRGRGVVHLSMIAAAVFSLLIADLGFAYKNSIDSYGTGAMVDAGWVVGWLLLAATALKPTVAELRRSDDEDGAVDHPARPPLRAPGRGRRHRP